MRPARPAPSARPREANSAAAAICAMVWSKLGSSRMPASPKTVAAMEVQESTAKWTTSIGRVEKTGSVLGARKNSHQAPNTAAGRASSQALRHGCGQGRNTTRTPAAARNESPTGCEATEAVSRIAATMSPAPVALLQRDQGPEPCRDSDQRRHAARGDHRLPAGTEEEQENGRGDGEQVADAAARQHEEEARTEQHERGHHEPGREVGREAEDIEQPVVHEQRQGDEVLVGRRVQHRLIEGLAGQPRGIAELVAPDRLVPSPVEQREGRPDHGHPHQRQRQRARCGASVQLRQPRRRSHRGMLPCFRFGCSTRLVCSVRRARISFGRVSWGTITSSM